MTMMRRWGFGLIASLLVLTSITACNPKRKGMGATPEPLYHDRYTDTRLGYRANDAINGAESAVGGGQNEIGYFKYIPANYHNPNNQAGPNVFVDRPLLARHIAQLVTVLPNVKEATALVTDDHIFLGIKPKNGTLDAKTIKEAKRTAESVTPRYYKVHVATNESLESQINSIGMRMTGGYDVQGMKGDLEQLLRKMGDDSPPDVNESLQPSSRKQINPNEK